MSFDFNWAKKLLTNLFLVPSKVGMRLINLSRLTHVCVDLSTCKERPISVTKAWGVYQLRRPWAWKCRQQQNQYLYNYVEEDDSLRFERNEG